MLYSDPSAEVESALANTSSPSAEVRDEYGVLHQLWKVSDPALIELVRSSMQDKKLIIADGHHRYETALNYRNERRAEAGAAPAPHMPYEFAMMTFVNMDSPGLVILPTHRVVRGVPEFSMDSFRTGASNYFSVEEADGNVTASRATAMIREAAHTGTSMLVVARERVFLLSRPKAPASAFGNMSFRQQSLDVVQLHKCLLEGVLRISEEAIRDQQNVTYVRDAEEAIAMVRNDQANVAFLMIIAHSGLDSCSPP
ncbi:MAG: hypothetical protein DMG95_13805 [Acidobacteria bacterium]|nr:MAG: hypothetical protein DMG95_13805 [Acidobacteriota bacterium]